MAVGVLKLRIDILFYHYTLGSENTVTLDILHNKTCNITKRVKKSIHIELLSRQKYTHVLYTSSRVT